MCGVDHGSYFHEWNVDSLMPANVDINKMGKDLKGTTSFPVFNTERFILT